MKLKLKYATQEEIPQGFEELYEERNGEWVLTGVEGMKTDEDISRLSEALRKERNDNKASKDALKAWGDLKPAEVLEKLDKFDEMAAASEGKIDETKLNQMVEARLNSRLAPIVRERDSLKIEVAEKTTKIEKFETATRERQITDAVRKAATDAKILPSAVEDALIRAGRVFELTEEGKVLTRDGVGVTPGLDAAAWMADMKAVCPHWWPMSAGGGATGGSGVVAGADNPFTDEGWNLTKQGQLVQKDPTLADRMAAQAGTKVGGPRPAPKKK